MHTGLSATVTRTITEVDTAAAIGSGDLPVLGTPRLLAWFEEATCVAVAAALPDGGTSVGTRVSLEHSSASPVGAEVRVEATLSYVDGRLLRFVVAATHTSDDKVLATGEVTRVVVDADRFLGRVGG
jgi:fluoroacetyl-CoA thioesterase